MKRTALIACALALPVCVAAQGRPVVALEASPDRGFYAEGVRNEIYVEARIRVGETTGADPGGGAGPVRNIAFVVDRSGSMAGERIQALREALLAVLDDLADRDIVSVVAFGSEVETLVEARRGDQARDLAAQIARLEPAGGAALFDALNQGAAQLRRYAGASTIDHLVLVCDGPPTRGPREFDDFARLAEVFAREGMTLSTIGLGEEFDEDMLAALARIGNGRFRYVAGPSGLLAALQDDLAPLQTVVGQDAVITIAFRDYFSDVKAHGWRRGVVEGRTVTFRLPHLFAGQEPAVLASAEARALTVGGAVRDMVSVRLRWRDLEGKEHERALGLTLQFTSETRLIRESANVAVYRSAVDQVVGEGLQKAIEHLDGGDHRRALGALRAAREKAINLNYQLNDPAIAAKIKGLEDYLAEIRARGMNQLDRKVLRSGLRHQFEPPVAGEEGG